MVYLLKHVIFHGYVKKPEGIGFANKNQSGMVDTSFIWWVKRWCSLYGYWHWSRRIKPHISNIIAKLHLKPTKQYIAFSNQTLNMTSWKFPYQWRLSWVPKGIPSGNLLQVAIENNAFIIIYTYSKYFKMVDFPVRYISLPECIHSCLFLSHFPIIPWFSLWITPGRHLRAVMPPVVGCWCP